MKAGDIVTHTEMCQVEGMMLQRGMVFRPPPNHGVVLMSQRRGAPYADVLDDDGILIYEGHDVPRSEQNPSPKLVDQPRANPAGTPTENGKFADWTDRHKSGDVPATGFNVYEKIRDGIWTFRGPFLLKDYRVQPSEGRRVFKFILQAVESADGYTASPQPNQHDLQTRQIPTWVKQFVYKRDKGRCVICGATDNLHYDHDLPFSKGGSSARPDNVRILCARHNLSKGGKIE